MLTTPITATENKMAPGRTQTVPARESVPYQQLPSTPRGRKLAAMQRAYGNQAVLRMLENAALRDGGLQRKCACGASAAGGECASCAAEREAALQRSATDRDSPAAVPPIVDQVLRSSGQPLDATTRAFMESRFGHDFSQVRVHTDAQAARSARAVGALAYTVGSDIAFAEGHFNPDSAPGSFLLAHELVHTLQQQRSTSRPPSGNIGQLLIGDPNDRSEAEADAFAEQALAPSHFSGTGMQIKSVGPSSTEPVLARYDCAKLKYRDCTTGVYKCGYGNSGTCGWVGPTRGGCICVGADKPPVAKVLAVLAILGLSILLLATIIAALADPEPATKLGLAGLSAAEIALLLSLLGYENPSGSGPTADVQTETEEEVA